MDSTERAARVVFSVLDLPGNTELSTPLSRCGVDSLTVTDLVLQLENEFNVRIDEAMLAPSIADATISEFISAALAIAVAESNASTNLKKATR